MEIWCKKSMVLKCSNQKHKLRRDLSVWIKTSHRIWRKSLKEQHQWLGCSGQWVQKIQLRSAKE